MTYTIYFRPADIGRSLNYYDCKKADTLNVGLLEQVCTDEIAWHGIQTAAELERVLNYLALEYGSILVAIEAEYYRGDKIFPQFVCGMKLDGFSYGHHNFTADEAVAQRRQRTE